MKATVGDRVRIHGRSVGMAVRTGEVVGIRGEDEHALLVVRFDGARVAPEVVITATLKLLVSREVLVLGVSRGQRLEERVLQLT